MNNTNGGATETGFANSGDQTISILNADVNYSSSVPEPSSMSYLLIGAIPLFFRFAKRLSR